VSGGCFDHPIEVRTDAEVPALLDAVHDQWIDLDQLDFGLLIGSIVVPFRSGDRASPHRDSLARGRVSATERWALWG
jgi:hypothetical protein